MKIFDIKENKLKEKQEKNNLEKDIQNLISKNLIPFNNSLFLENEYSINTYDIDRGRFSGRIDTIALGEDLEPIIIEYKKGTNENIINQGLFYIDWLLENKAEFEKLLINKSDDYIKEKNTVIFNNFLNKKEINIDEINWDQTKLICLAKNYNKYDKHSIEKIDLKIELYTYKIFDGLLYISDLLSKQKDKSKIKERNTIINNDVKNDDHKRDSFEYRFENSPDETRELVKYIEEKAYENFENINILKTKFYWNIKEISSIFSFYISSAKEVRIFLFTNQNKNKLIKHNKFENLSGKGHWAIGDFKYVATSKKEKYLWKII